MPTHPEQQRGLPQYTQGEEEDEGWCGGEESRDVCGCHVHERPGVHVVGGGPDQEEQNGGGEDAADRDTLGGEDADRVTAWREARAPSHTHTLTQHHTRTHARTHAHTHTCTHIYTHHILYQYTCTLSHTHAQA